MSSQAIDKILGKDFLISSEQCKILFHLDRLGSLSKVAEAMGRDISVLSRQMGQLADIAPVVEKINGKWRVSRTGKLLGNWAADAILAQQKILRESEHIVIATTGEFSARILAPQLEKIFGDCDELNVTILAPSNGIEDVILSGEADIGLGCGRPKDPAIKFHKIVADPYIIVASPKLLEKKRIKTVEDLAQYPHLRHTGFDSGRFLGFSTDALKIRASFNHLTGIRGACLASLGWAILPRYSVNAELGRSELIEIKLHDFKGATEKDDYGVWWLRERKNLDSWAQKFIAWLRQQKL